MEQKPGVGAKAAKFPSTRRTRTTRYIYVLPPQSSEQDSASTRNKGLGYSDTGIPCETCGLPVRTGIFELDALMIINISYPQSTIRSESQSYRTTNNPLTFSRCVSRPKLSTSSPSRPLTGSGPRSSVRPLMAMKTVLYLGKMSLGHSSVGLSTPWRAGSIPT